MGMTKCPDCGKDISEAATSCIGCGRPMTSAVALPSIAVDSSVYSLIAFVGGLIWAYFWTMWLVSQAASFINPLLLIILFPIVTFPLFWSVRKAKKVHAELAKSSRNTALPTIVKVIGYIGLGILSALWLLLINLRWIVNVYRGYTW